MCQKMMRKIKRSNSEVEKYRKYHEEKSQIPMDLSAAEFEERVKELARKYHI